MRLVGQATYLEHFAFPWTSRCRWRRSGRWSGLASRRGTPALRRNQLGQARAVRGAPNQSLELPLPRHFLLGAHHPECRRSRSWVRQTIGSQSPEPLEVTAVSRIHGARRIHEVTRGHEEDPFRVQEEPRGHRRTRADTPLRRFGTVRPRVQIPGPRPFPTLNEVSRVVNGTAPMSLVVAEWCAANRHDTSRSSGH